MDVAFDVEAVRGQFPILQRRLLLEDGRETPLTFLDHGASTHAPAPVVDEVSHFLHTSYANVHRGNHRLSQESSDRFDGALAQLAHFVGADPEVQPAVLMGNTTQALDLAAHLMADQPGTTLTTLMEHHSNDLPHRRRGPVVHAQVDPYGRVDMDDIQAHLDKGDVKLLAVTGASNVTGYLPPVHRLARMAHDAGARILVDAAQLLAHAPLDVKAPDHPEHLDMVAAAGHKAYAPFGASVLIAPRTLIDQAPPYMPGGGTVTWVTDDDVGFVDGPERHQGGTPNIAGVIAFAAATRFLSDIGMEAIRSHEEEILRVGMRRFQELQDEHGVALLGPVDPAEKAAVFSFVVPGEGHAHVSTLLDQKAGIATRNGCFCAHPMMVRLLQVQSRDWIDAMERGDQVELPGATRATFGVYNRMEDLDLLCDTVAAIARTRKVPA